jgi:hypothetical protein
MVITIKMSICMLLIMATLTATETIIPGLIADLLNPVMAQGNITGGNTTAGNMTTTESIISTSPVGSKQSSEVCHDDNCLTPKS